MRLKNYASFLIATRCNKSAPGKKYSGDTVSLTNSYNTSYGYNGLSGATLPPGGSLSGYPGYSLFIGSGTTAVTADDYALEQEITSGFTVQKAEVNLNADTGEIAVSRVYTNTTDAPLAIHEAGVYFYGSFGLIMLHREVFDEPLVIPPYESAVITAVIQ